MDGEDFLLPDLFVDVLAMNPKNPKVLYAAASGGLYRTGNGGASWQPADTGLPPTMNVDTIAVDPSAPATVYAAGLGPGVYVTHNSGQTWVPFNTGIPTDDYYDQISDLAIGTNGDLIYGANPGGVYQVKVP